MTRSELERDWLRLTREHMPALAEARGWPVANDHCFQRILLDNACGACWYHVVRERPAYTHAPDALLAAAVALGRAAIAGKQDLAALNRRSLGWRRARG